MARPRCWIGVGGLCWVGLGWVKLHCVAFECAVRCALRYSAVFYRVASCFVYHQS